MAKKKEVNKDDKKPKDGMLYWKEIPENSTIEDTGTTWIATKPDGSKDTVYWMGKEGKEAQKFLRTKPKTPPKTG